MAFVSIFSLCMAHLDLMMLLISLIVFCEADKGVRGQLKRFFFFVLADKAICAITCLPAAAETATSIACLCAPACSSTVFTAVSLARPASYLSYSS